MFKNGILGKNRIGWREPSEKDGGNNYFLATRERSLEEESPGRLFHVQRGRCRIRHNLGSWQAVLNLRNPHAESRRYFALRKTVDDSILSPEPRDSPRNSFN
jgi:hypothetical protein